MIITIKIIICIDLEDYPWDWNEKNGLMPTESFRYRTDESWIDPWISVRQ